MKKRIIALAAAAVAALALGGVNLAGHAGTARADGPTGASGIAVGCVNILGGTASTAIQFVPATLQQVATPGSNGAANVNNNFYLTTPGNYLQCGAVLQGLASPFTVPANLSCSAVGGAPTANNTCVGNGPTDGNPNTVDTGSVTYTLNGANGRFVFLDNNSNTITIACAATLTQNEPPGFDQCVGAVPNGTNISPNPALVVKVGLAPGVPLSAFGNLGTISALNSGFSLTATYNRQTSSYSAVTVTCTGGTASAPATCTTNPANASSWYNGATLGTIGNTFACAAATPCVFTLTFNPTGSSTATASVNITVVAPTYAMYLTANPSTIPATPPSGGAVASGAQGGGSTITAVLYTNNGLVGPLSYAPGAISPSAPVPGTASVVVSPTGSLLTLGVEPGTVTFQTNLGIFGSPATTSASAQQTVSVACGALPGSSLGGIIYNPATFGFGTFSFSSCTTATATLYGGGAAGTATILATYVGSVTGQTAQATTTVAIAAAPASVTLNRGCNEEITPASLASNSPASAVVNLVNPSSAVVSVWQYNNATQKFNALYFNNPQAPVDQTTVGPSQSVFICVSSTATYQTGTY